MYIRWKGRNHSFPTSIYTPMFLLHHIWVLGAFLKVTPEKRVIFSIIENFYPLVVYEWGGGLSVRVHYEGVKFEIDAVP